MSELARTYKEKWTLLISLLQFDWSLKRIPDPLHFWPQKYKTGVDKELFPAYNEAANNFNAIEQRLFTDLIEATGIPNAAEL